MWPTGIRIANIAMLILAIPPLLPYGYYTLLRIITCGVTALLGYLLFKANNTGWAVCFMLFAVVYNPILPFHLGKGIWVLLNIATIVILGMSFRLMPSKIICQSIKSR